SERGIWIAPPGGEIPHIPWRGHSDRDSCSGPADAGCRVPGPGRCNGAPERARDENRDDAAIDSYRQALKLKPEWDEGLWYLGTLLYEKENYFEACTVLRGFLARNQENAYGWALLGLSEFE